MENSNDTGKLIGTLLIGAAIGGVLGILFAPAKGSETRKKLTGKADDLADLLKEKLDAFSKEAKEEFEAKKEKAMEFAENGKGK